MDNLIEFNLLGTGGISRIVLDLINNHYLNFRAVAFFDDDVQKKGMTISGIPVNGTINDFITLSKSGIFYHNCIGNYAGLRNRILYSRLLTGKGLVPVSLIHPTSFISRTSAVHDGVLICPNATINSNTFIGKENIIFSNSVVEHDVITGDYCYLSPSVTLCGKVKLEDHIYIGPGAVIGASVHIGRNVIVGAGSVVLHDIPDNSVYYGNPSVFQKKNELWGDL